MLLALRPSSMRWIPHDIDSSTSSTKKGKDKDKPKRRLLSFKPSSSSKEPNHGTPKRRKSTLSISSTPDEELDARTHMQGQSMLFARVPIEIRKMVYEFIMGRETVHLTLGAKKRFGHFVCPQGEDEHEVVMCDCKVLVGGAGHSGRLGSACLGVLRVCRRMYHEAIPHLYTPHTFSLLHPTHLLYLPTRIPQPRLNTIRRLRLRMTIRALPYFRRANSKHLAYPEDTANWEKTWNILTSMAGLRELRVVLIDKSPDGIWEQQWLSLEERLLGPVKRVCRPRDFVVVLPYRSCRVDWEMGGSGCVLRRPDGDGEEEEEEEEEGEES
ncbi:hypothetical protein K458DRAFT_297585 [Lentithecium fluviatile CBS 122367]|uniref:DUF7730 domain-containing protein n=1 Tax=Lentithecium fluviatile CBS 122367 TaxID=1168545 RepID=A0A6G1J8D5_9PLEO|nr:hypothetical protein K458DRAFT_297585 [Lentithecium fluviatile CBS 122367]